MRDIITVYLDGSACNLIQAANEVEECGLAAAALTKHENKTCIGQGQVDVIERLAFLVLFGTVDFVERCDFDHNSLQVWCFLTYYNIFFCICKGFDISKDHPVCKNAYGVVLYCIFI